MLCDQLFSFFEFLAPKVSLSVLGRTRESKRSIYAQYRCTQKLRGPKAQAVYRRNCFLLCDQLLSYTSCNRHFLTTIFVVKGVK